MIFIIRLGINIINEVGFIGWFNITAKIAKICIIIKPELNGVRNADLRCESVFNSSSAIFLFNSEGINIELDVVED
ncbi:MAG: hypothetical protein H0T53_09170 [Herpetosiphonaceae bacterium]|nr:hypothetical protein [Herpetosiphonaceae bacterium]